MTGTERRRYRLSVREEKLLAADYWLKRADEAWRLAHAYQREAETFEQFAADAEREAGET